MARKVKTAQSSQRRASTSKEKTIATRKASPSPNEDRESALRVHLQKLLDWDDAHVDFDRVVDGIPAELRGAKVQTLPYSLWQLVEHLRLCQRDILDFCRNPKYVEPASVEDYWPASSVPPDDHAWETAIAAFREDRRALQRLAADRRTDLFAPIPHGSGQTYVRELLLVADHNAYHVGQLVALRRQLRIWSAS